MDLFSIKLQITYVHQKKFIYSSSKLNNNIVKCLTFGNFLAKNKVHANILKRTEYKTSANLLVYTLILVDLS